MRKLSTAIAAGALLAAAPLMSAQALSAYTLTIGGDTNNPTFTLTNTSTALERILAFEFTIGDTAFNFDATTGHTAPAGGTVTPGAPGTGQNGARTDFFRIDYTNFDPGESSSNNADVDRDNANTVENFNSVFFNNGMAPNSIASVFFDNDVRLDLTLPDQAQTMSSYTFGQSASMNPVPVPAALPLMASGLGLLGFMGWRRKKA